MTAKSDAPLTRELAARLTLRQAELREELEDRGERIGQEVHDVVDFKDIAAEDAQAVVDDVADEHAARELSEVSAALRRIQAGTYGTCQSCGEAIDERRLRALPATPSCTACQADLERAHAAR